MDEKFETIIVKRHSEEEGDGKFGAYRLTKLDDEQGRTYESFDKLGWDIKDNKKYKIGYVVWSNGNLRFSHLEEAK
jgi:hypothetical protein